MSNVVVSIVPTDGQEISDAQKSVPDTVECRHNAVNFITILQTELQWQQQNVNKTWNTQQTPHTSP